MKDQQTAVQLPSSHIELRSEPASKSVQISFILKEYGLPLLLLAISLVTTTAIGARFMQNFLEGQPTVVVDSDLWPWPWLLENPSRFNLGWPFSIALLTILLTHEFGHYFACRAHQIRVTLPWLLPAPTLSGTAGAIILIRGRIPNRRALMDVGVSGPFAGYIASLIAIAIGLHLSMSPIPHQSEALIHFGQPLTIELVHQFLTWFYPSTHSFDAATKHPVLVAGWIGLFITSLNLMPGGQLDGGHILYAIVPKAHKACTLTLSALLIVCGFFFWMGWLLWGLLLLIPAMKHPNVPLTQPLNKSRYACAALAFVILALTFSISPFLGSSILHYIIHP